MDLGPPPSCAAAPAEAANSDGRTEAAWISATRWTCKEGETRFIPQTGSSSRLRASFKQSTSSLHDSDAEATSGESVCESSRHRMRPPWTMYTKSFSFESMDDGFPSSPFTRGC